MTNLYIYLEYCGTKQVKDFKQIVFAAQVRKTNKDILVARAYGSKVKIKDPLSDISLEVAKGVKGLVMQSVNIDYYLLRKVIPATECLAAPVVQFHMEEKVKHAVVEGCKYKITIPHYLNRHHDLSSVRVRYGSLHHPLMMKEVQKTPPDNPTFPCFEINNKHITVYENHFCSVVCTSMQKVCTSKIVAIPFRWIGSIGPDLQTDMKVKIYLCSYLYSNNDLKQASYFLLLEVKFSLHLYFCSQFWFFTQQIF